MWMHSLNTSLQLLQLATTLFDCSDMEPGFRGAHTLMIHAEHPTGLTLNIWAKGKSWPFFLKSDDLYKSPADLMREIVALLEAQS